MKQTFDASKFNQQRRGEKKRRQPDPVAKRTGSELHVGKLTRAFCICCCETLKKKKNLLLTDFYHSAKWILTEEQKQKKKQMIVNKQLASIYLVEMKIPI